MKKFAKIVLIVLMLATCIFAVVACDNNKTTKISISISEANMPQTVYVQGQDFDLTKGKITVDNGKTKTDVALNAEGVEVKGFDKDVLGTQTLTITYSGASTTLEVKVVERMSIAPNSNLRTDYVVGETFNNGGRLNFTKDDGETISVYLRDQKLTFSGFDTSSEGTKVVNVVYQDGDLVLAGSYTINVYTPDVITISKPNKLVYKSHETELDLSGAWFNVKVTDKNISRPIEIDPNSASGYNPEVVDEEHTSVKQTITVKYPNGGDYTFDITVELSDVTRIKRAAKALASLDWSGNSVSPLTEAQRNLAISCMKKYFALSEEDKAVVDEDDTVDMLNIARPAAAYGSEVWTARLAAYEKLFTVDGSTLEFTCENYAETKQLYEEDFKLIKEDDVLLVYSELLTNIKGAFGKEVLFDKKTINEYLTNVCSLDDVEKAMVTITFMLKIHEALEEIPVDWTIDDLNTEENAQHIEDGYLLIGLLCQFKFIDSAIEDRYIFDIISSWREKDDYFEIMYRYYYALYLTGETANVNKATDRLDNLMLVKMPGILESFYLQYVRTLIEQMYITYSGTVGDVQFQPAANVDTINFIVAFRNLVKIQEVVLESDDDMINTLYTIYSFGEKIANLETGDFGYLQVLGSACGEEAFEAIWTKYIDLIASLASDDVGQKLEDTFKAFVALTPELQIQFIESLNTYKSTLLFDVDGTGRAVTFYELLVYYYADLFPQNMLSQNDENGIVFELLDGLQYYLLRNIFDEDNSMPWFDAFLSTMKNVETMYGTLSASDKALFDKHLSFAYERYIGIAKLYDNDGKLIEKEIEEKWQKQLDEITTMNTNLFLLFQVAAQDITKMPLFIASYEYTAQIYNDILANAPVDVVNKMLYDNTLLIESLLYKYRNLYMQTLGSYPINSQYTIVAWDTYQESDLGAYMASLIDFYILVAGNKDMTLEQVKAAMKGYLELTDVEKVLFVQMDGNGEYMYYKALRAFFTKTFNIASGALNIANEILDIQIDLNLTADGFLKAWEKIEDEYAALSDTEKNLVDTNLKEVYDYYQALYDEMTASQDNQ